MAGHEQQVDQVDLEALTRQLPPAVRGRLPPGFWLGVDFRHGRKGTIIAATINPDQDPS